MHYVYFLSHVYIYVFPILTPLTGAVHIQLRTSPTLSKIGTHLPLPPGQPPTDIQWFFIESAALQSLQQIKTQIVTQTVFTFLLFLIITYYPLKVHISPPENVISYEEDTW